MQPNNVNRSVAGRLGAAHVLYLGAASNQVPCCLLPDLIKAAAYAWLNVSLNTRAAEKRSVLFVIVSVLKFVADRSA